MNRVLTGAMALMVLVAVFTVVGQSEANAGLFNRDKCCKTKCSKPKKCRKARRCRKPKCCEPAPVCEAAPVCEPAPVCCEAPAPTCCEDTNKCCLSRRQARKARRKGCCVQTCSYVEASCNSCGGAAVQGCSSCGGGEAAPAEAAPAEAAPEAPAAPAAPAADATT